MSEIVAFDKERWFWKLTRQQLFPGSITLLIIAHVFVMGSKFCLYQWDYTGISSPSIFRPGRQSLSLSGNAVLLIWEPEFARLLNDNVAVDITARRHNALRMYHRYTRYLEGSALGSSSPEYSLEYAEFIGRSLQ